MYRELSDKLLELVKCKQNTLGGIEYHLRQRKYLMSFSERPSNFQTVGTPNFRFEHPLCRL